MDSIRHQKTLLDRLSALPNPVLSHILSFIPTKQAVSTSILSRPWRHVWKSIPDIELDDTCLLGCCSSSGKIWRYLESIHRLLLLREDPIRRFGLRCYHECNSPYVFSWISLALYFQPREVNVKLTMENLHPVPSQLFASGNLVKIELSGSVLVDVRGVPVFLPNVKNLRLDKVCYSCAGSIEKIVSGCPNLEDLDICRSKVDEDVELNISAPLLKFLTVTFRECDYHLKDALGVENLEYVLVIDTPNIEDLHLNDMVTKKYDVKDGSWCSLKEAYVNVRGNTRAFAVVKALWNAKALALSSGTLSSILFEDEEDNLPTYFKLTQLELGIGDSCLFIVNEFLLTSPNLEILIFEKEREREREYTYKEPFWIAPIRVPRCLRFKLKEITFEDFFGNNYEVRLLKYLLTNAQVLDHMTVRSPKFKSFTKRLYNFRGHGQLHLMP